MQGKTKYMVENRTGDPLDPSPDSDCHMSKSHNVDLQSVSPQEAFESTQVCAADDGGDDDGNDDHGPIFHGKFCQIPRHNL